MTDGPSSERYHRYAELIEHDQSNCFCLEQNVLRMAHGMITAGTGVCGPWPTLYTNTNPFLSISLVIDNCNNDLEREMIQEDIEFLKSKRLRQLLLQESRLHTGTPALLKPFREELRQGAGETNSLVWWSPTYEAQVQKQLRDHKNVDSVRSKRNTWTTRMWTRFGCSQVVPGPREKK